MLAHEKLTKSQQRVLSRSSTCAQNLPGSRSRVFPVAHHRAPRDEDLFDARRSLMGVGESAAVDDRVGIEEDQIGLRSHLEVPAVREAELARR